MSARALLVVPLVVVSLLGACSADGGHPPAAGSSPPASPTADVDYPDEGLDLVGAPTLKGVYQGAWQTYVDFERGRRLTAREGRVVRLLSFNATGDVVDPYRAALAAYGGRGTYGGDVTVEVVAARPHGDRLLLDLCVDATGLDVPADAPTLLGEATRAPEHVEVGNILGPWRVTRVDPLDGSC